MIPDRRPCVLAALLFLGAPAEAAHVVVGVTPVDASSTALVAIDLDQKDAPPMSFGDVAHRQGHAPVGVIIDDDSVALVVEVGNKSDGLLVRRVLGTGVETSLLDEVVPTHAPLVWSRPDGGTELVAVRLRDESARGGTFDVVGVDLKSGTSAVRASGQRLWVTPVHGHAPGLAPAFLVVDGGPGFQGPVSVAGATRGEKTGDGHAHLDIVIDGTLVTRHRLGPGSFRSPVRQGELILVEHAVEPGRTARLVDARGVEHLRGRPGLSPRVSPSGRVLAASSSKKDGTVLVRTGTGEWQTLSSGRAGVARPLHVVEGGVEGGKDGDVVVVIAWLDRGVSLPGELWAIRSSGGQLLLPPAPRTAVTVYGTVTSLPPTTTTPTTPTLPTTTEVK